MDYIREYVITLVTAVILVTAVEIISPDNSIKKYIRFVLGLIMVSILIRPFVDIFSKSEEDFVQLLDKYTVQLFDTTEENLSNNDETIELFINNLNESCVELLKEQFESCEFSVDVRCDVDLDEEIFVIKEVNVYTSNISYKDDIKKCLAENLDISTEIIKVCEK